MSFLAPLFLLGGLAIALPVVFHLIRRTTRNRTAFSSLMFLLPSPPRLTRRSRLEHILLLLLRCAVLALLAFGFARPFIKTGASNPASNNTAKRMVLLVDNSASMRRGNLWPDARAKAETILRQTKPGDQVAVFTFGQRVNRLVTFAQWNAASVGDRVGLAVGRLSEASPDWSDTQMGQALITAAEALEEADDKPTFGPRQIVLISDLQSGSRLGPLQAYEWPRDVELTLESVKVKQSVNAGLQLRPEADEADPKSPKPTLRVRVSNASDSHREQFQIGWAGADGKTFAGAAVDVYVPPGQTRVTPAPEPPTNSTPNRLLLRGDTEDFDNTVFVIPPKPAQNRVLYLGTDSSEDTKQPLYFLQRAFQETRRQAVEVLAHKPDDPIQPSELENVALVIATAPLPETQAGVLRRLMVEGKTVLFSVTGTNCAPALARILEVDRIPVEEATVKNYAMLAEIDFKHPLLDPVRRSALQRFHQDSFLEIPPRRCGMRFRMRGYWRNSIPAMQRCSKCRSAKAGCSCWPRAGRRPKANWRSVRNSFRCSIRCSN